MKKKERSALCLLVTVISFLGFWVENIWLSISRGCMNNRNMLLPFLFGYGLSVLVMYRMFGTPRAPRLFGLDLDTRRTVPNLLIYYGMVFVCISLGEILLGTLVEWSTGIVWWDYTRIPLHITKYTSVPTSAGFALLITVFMRFIIKPTAALFMRMNETVLSILAWVFMGLMVADFLHSGLYMFLHGELMRTWRVDIPWFGGM